MKAQITLMPGDIPKDARPYTNQEIEEMVKDLSPMDKVLARRQFHAYNELLRTGKPQLIAQSEITPQAHVTHYAKHPSASPEVPNQELNDHRLKGSQMASFVHKTAPYPRNGRIRRESGGSRSLVGLPAAGMDLGAISLR